MLFLSFVLIHQRYAEFRAGYNEFLLKHKERKM